MRKYNLLSMNDIKKLADQKKFNVISTFSGGGGSSLGLKQAGANILAMNEFIPKAMETYKANFILKNSNTIPFDDDIRELHGIDIMNKVGIKRGELDMLEGSPPCSAFSSCGLKEKGFGIEKKYSDNKTQVVDDLFFEYIRLIDEINPKTFIAENVVGLTYNYASDYLKNILKKMRELGYHLEYRILNSADYGAPQVRKRIIFIGVRKDVWDKLPDLNEYWDSLWPTKKYNKVTWMTVDEAFDSLPNKDKMIGWSMINLDSKTLILWKKAIPGQSFDIPSMELYNKASWFNHYRVAGDKPSPTLTTKYSCFLHSTEPRCFSVEEYSRLMGVPDDYINLGTIKQKMERLGRMVCPHMYAEIGKHLDSVIFSKLKEMET